MSRFMAIVSYRLLRTANFEAAFRTESRACYKNQDRQTKVSEQCGKQLSTTQTEASDPYESFRNHSHAIIELTKTLACSQKICSTSHPVTSTAEEE